MDNTAIIETKNKRASLADGEIIYRNGLTEKIEYGITEIEEKTYSANDDIVCVVLPESVTKICQHAFFHCTNLKSITLPDSVEEICFGAFSHCASMTSIKLPNGITKIPSFCFSPIPITEITIPESVEEIDSFAFFHCMELKKIYLPKGIKIINDTAFLNCILSDVYYNGSKDDWEQRHYEKLNDIFAGAKIYYNGTAEEKTKTAPQNGLFQSIKNLFGKK